MRGFSEMWEGTAARPLLAVRHGGLVARYYQVERS
jgi:hypothetical protein